MNKLGPVSMKKSGRTIETYPVLLGAVVELTVLETMNASFHFTKCDLTIHEQTGQLHNTTMHLLKLLPVCS